MSLAGEHSVTPGVCHDLRPALEMQMLNDLAHVIFDRPLAQPQDLADFLIKQALADKAQDLHLAGRQAILPGRGIGGICLLGVAGQ